MYDSDGGGRRVEGGGPMDDNEAFNDIDLDALMTNHLAQLNTKWFNIKEWGTPPARLTGAKGNLALLHVWRTSVGLYRFSLHLKDGDACTYDFYHHQDSGGGPLAVVTNRAVGGGSAKLAPAYSALYVVYLARHLALYHEPITVSALPTLDMVMHSPGGRLESHYAPITASLLYHNLSGAIARANPEIGALVEIVAPDQYGTGTIRAPCVLMPVYGPAHQPLRIRYAPEKANYRVFFGHYNANDDRPQHGVTDIVVPQGAQSVGNCAYDLVALVEAIARWVVRRNGGDGNLGDFLASYQAPSEDELGRLNAEATSFAIPPDVLFAIKAAQLCRHDDDDARVVALAQKMHLHVYDEYRALLHGGGGGGGVDGSDDWLQRQATATLRHLLQDLVVVNQ